MIESLGGTSFVASELALKPPVVSNWRARGKIPPEFWSEIVSLAAARQVDGVTLEALAAMHAREPATEARP